MFANCQLTGMNFAFPDVLLTPVGPVMVPIPYPNNQLLPAANPATACKKIFLSGMPAHNLMTMIPFSFPGVGVGALSGMCMGPCFHIKGSTSVIWEGAPATRWLDMTVQNGGNCVGSTMVPSQFKYIIMK
jgi:hypothetical protein